MNDDEITADDVRAGLLAVDRMAKDLLGQCDDALHAEANRALSRDVVVVKTLGVLIGRAVFDARDRRLSERTMLAAEARADAEREDLR